MKDKDLQYILKAPCFQPISVCEYSIRIACKAISDGLNEAADRTLDYGMNGIVHRTCEEFTNLLIAILFDKEKGENEDGK